MKSLSFSMALLCAIGEPHVLTGQCIQSGPIAVSVYANNTGMGSVAWNSPALAGLSDNLPAQAAQTLGILASANTNYLLVEAAGFAIPAGASVCGISVSVERSAGGLSLGGSVTDASVRLLRGGVISGANRASASGWPGSDAVASYGGAADLWGIAWTPTDVNAAGFGVAISVTLSAGLVSVAMAARVDQVTITVHYLNPVVLPAKPALARWPGHRREPLPGFYPNPAGDAIYLTGKRTRSVVLLKDLHGRVVRTFRVPPAARLPRLSLQDIPPGVYLLAIEGQVLRLLIGG